MNASEKTYAEKTAQLSRFVRKELGLSQKDMAQKLETTQGTISKIERGFLVPSAFQWLACCKLADISPDSLYTGLIDRDTNVTLHSRADKGANFKVPARYSYMMGSTVRSVRSIQKFFDSLFGEQAFSDHCEGMGIDRDYFVCLDNQFNINFALELIQAILSRQKIGRRQLEQSLYVAPSPEIHGNVYRHYENSASPIARLEAFIKKSPRYGVNFDYQIEESTERSLTFSLSPRAHLREFKRGFGQESCRFISAYRETYFDLFANSGASGQRARVAAKGDGTRILQKTTYQLKLERCLAQ